MTSKYVPELSPVSIQTQRTQSNRLRCVRCVIAFGISEHVSGAGAARAGAENGAKRARKPDERERSGRSRERSGEPAESAAHNPLKLIGLDGNRALLVTREMGFHSVNFGLPRPFCSRVKSRHETDRQTDGQITRHHGPFHAPSLRGGGITNQQKHNLESLIDFLVVLNKLDPDHAQCAICASHQLKCVRYISDSENK